MARVSLRVRRCYRNAACPGKTFAERICNWWRPLPGARADEQRRRAGLALTCAAFGLVYLRLPSGPKAFYTVLGLGPLQILVLIFLFYAHGS